MKKISFVFFAVLTVASFVWAGTVTFSSREVLTASKLNSGFAEKTDVIRFLNNSTATQAKLNQKLNSGGVGTFSHISTSSTANRYINIGNSSAYTGTRKAGTIFHNMTTTYYCETDNVCKRIGSGSESTTDLTGYATTAYVDSAVAGAGSLPQFSNYTGADGASWIDKGSEPPSLVTRIGNKLYSIVMSLKATLYAILGWSSNSHDFGTTVTSGSFGNYSTLLSNTGAYDTGAITFSNLSSAIFRTYSTSTTTIAAGSNRRVKYQFTPANTNPHTGHLHASAANGQLAAVLQLTGTGATAGTPCTGTIGVSSGATTVSTPSSQNQSITRFSLGCTGPPATINATVGAGEYILTVYADDGTGTNPTTLLWNSSEFNETNSSSHTITANITGLTIYQATYIWIGITVSNGSPYYRDTTTPGAALNKAGSSDSTTAPTPDNPWDTANDTVYTLGRRGVWLTF